MDHLISIRQVEKDIIETLNRSANEIHSNPGQFYDALKGSVLVTAFFEPSTRTRVGFSIAMQKLGGSVTDIPQMKFNTSMNAPESIEDTLRVVGDYADVVALRSPHETGVRTLSVPNRLINCGNGQDEHPTQALIDIYAVHRQLKTLDGLRYAIVGDLNRMRSAHSLFLALQYFNPAEIALVSPESRKMPRRYFLEAEGPVTVREVSEFDIRDADVVYMAGFPPDGTCADTSAQMRARYVMDLDRVSGMTPNSIILCPLPRIDEITKDVDSSPQAKYFEQCAQGLYMRMAILKMMLSK